MSDGWTSLYGNFEKNEISLRLVRTEGKASWRHALEEGAIHLFLNLEGTSLVLGSAARLPLVPKTIGFCHVGDIDQMIASSTSPEDNSLIIILCATPAWVEKNFGSKKQFLHKTLIKLLDEETQQSVLLNKVRSMSYLEYELCSSLLKPPVHNDAKSFWFLAKIIEILALHLFKPPSLQGGEPFCSFQKRLAKERVDKVLIWLEENLDQSLDLKKLAASIHCSPPYLSRVFSENTGTTISKKLRTMRINKASDLLAEGDYNITEVALEVGYNSLSHFSKAFQEVIGKKPSAYLRELQITD